MVIMAVLGTSRIFGELPVGRGAVQRQEDRTPV